MEAISVLYVRLFFILWHALLLAEIEPITYGNFIFKNIDPDFILLLRHLLHGN